MDKCFIEFPNYNLYICYDDVFCYINFVISKYDVTLFSLLIKKIKCIMVLST